MRLRPRGRKTPIMPSAKRIKEGDLITHWSDGPSRDATTKIRARIEGTDYYRKPGGEDFILIKARVIRKEIVYRRVRTQ